MLEYLGQLAAALVITVIVEGLTAWLFGLRTKKELRTVVLINVITNPLLNYLLLLNYNIGLVDNRLLLVGLLECCVVAAEWWMLGHFLHTGNKKSAVLSVSMNTASFLAGFLVFSPGSIL